MLFGGLQSWLNRLAALAGLLIVLPLLLVAAVSIDALSGRPVFIEEVVAIGGDRRARVWRLRTFQLVHSRGRMVAGFLRTYGVDHLPGLCSVVRGELSLMELFRCSRS